MAILANSQTDAARRGRHNGAHDAAGSGRWLQDEARCQCMVGIPFAAPPVGDLRWRAPRPAQTWSVVAMHCRSATCACSSRRLLSGGTAGPGSAPVGNEDCLYLNVWAPPAAPGNAPAGDAAHPVMVWIHGGGNSIGHGGSYSGDAPRARSRRRRCHDQLSPRRRSAGSVIRRSQCRCIVRRQFRQLWPVGSDRGAAVGARQHRGVRRQSRQRHDLRRIGRRRRRTRTDDVAARAGSVSSRHRRKRRLLPLAIAMAAELRRRCRTGLAVQQSRSRRSTVDPERQGHRSRCRKKHRTQCLPRRLVHGYAHNPQTTS